MSDDARRYLRLFIPQSDILNILGGRIEINYNLPDDVEVIAATEDPIRYGFSLILKSATFAPVPLGEEIPSHFLPIERRKVPN